MLNCATTVDFVDSLYDTLSGGYRSVPGGMPTLYGTCYGIETRYFVGGDLNVRPQTVQFIRDCQDPETGLFVGPELQ